jgi:Holliday junction resolvase
VSEYSRGNDAERKVAELLRGDGYEVWQTRGSKGYADLIAIKPGQICLVQVKGAKAAIDWYEWNGLFLLAEKLEAVALVADFPEWRKGKAGPVRFRMIHGMRKRYSRVYTWPCIEWHSDELAEELF